MRYVSKGIIFLENYVFHWKICMKIIFFFLNALLSPETSNSPLVFVINILSFPSAVGGRMLEPETLFHPIGGEVTTGSTLEDIL